MLQAGITQLRVSGMGGTIGFDYVALKILADTMGVDISQSLWAKVRAVENVIRKIEAKNQERLELKNKKHK